MSDNAVIATILGMGAIAVVVGLVILVLTIIAWWKIFSKAGEAGWKSLIPVYNTYISYKIAWQAKWFWIWIGLFVVSSILSFMSGNAFVTVLSFVISVALVVIGILFSIKLSKAFGHGAGFAVGLIFLNTIFVLILGFGSSQYVGAQE